MMRRALVLAAAVVGVIGVVACGSTPSAAPTVTVTATTGGTTSAASTPATTTKPKPDETAGQKNAREEAEQYLQTGSFSRAGLIKQLSSQYGSGYSKADAIYAVNHIDVNWNEQAAKAAKAYLATGPFSRAGLIQQLESSYGDGFTHAQAVYGVNKAGL
jgi:host cell surface-exposed lipoprotein